MSATTVTVRRLVAGPPEVAWRAWTDPAELARWWWPQWADTTYEIDPVVGGRYAFVSRAVGLGVRGELTAVDEPRLLAMTWVWDDGEPGPVDDVVVTFEPAGEETLVTVSHTSTAHTEGGGYEQGWNDVLDRLGRRP